MPATWQQAIAEVPSDFMQHGESALTIRWSAGRYGIRCHVVLGETQLFQRAQEVLHLGHHAADIAGRVRGRR